MQVKRAQTHLLEHLYSHVTNLGTAEGGENLLDEEPEVMQRRAAGQKSLQVCCCGLLMPEAAGWCCSNIILLGDIAGLKSRQSSHNRACGLVV